VGFIAPWRATHSAALHECHPAAQSVVRLAHVVLAPHPAMFVAKLCVFVPLAQPEGLTLTHEPLEQKGVVPLHAAPLSCHCPQASQTCGWVPEHCSSPGEQTGVPHEHTPHVHVPNWQACVP
jgi:hypothetical protein